jgi:hypothetical protein
VSDISSFSGLFEFGEMVLCQVVFGDLFVSGVVEELQKMLLRQWILLAHTDGIPWRNV